jgi:Arylsulfotransferase (ASST)
MRSVGSGFCLVLLSLFGCAQPGNVDVSGTGGDGTTGSGGTASTASGGSPGSGATGGGAATASGGVTGTGGTRATGGTTGSAGAKGTGGAIGAAGAKGTGGATSTGGATGSAGQAGTTSCTITATSSFSTAIPTVAAVTWSTTLSNVTRAEIDFGPAAGGTALVAPVDLTQASYRTLLLGMKPSTSYAYKIVATNASGSCSSNSYTIMTGALPSAPKVTTSITNASAHDKGFIITSTGLSANTTFIIDADGTVVWSATGPSMPSRSHMSWDGTHMYMMALNVLNTNQGNIESVAMDGTGNTPLAGLTSSHHDLTAIPGGFATMLWNKSGTDAPCSLIERADATGAITTVVADMSTVYNSSTNTFHSNAVHYYPSDNTYTVGDRNPSLYVKLSRTGSLIWQFGGSNPKDQSKFFTGVPTWSVNHGHQLLADGTFLFFNNTPNEAWVYKLNTSNMTAAKTLTYTATGAASSVLGDVQRLPNGNYLVTFSTSGQIHEISPSGALVAKFTSTSFGYSEFRESLYGEPPY